MTRARKTGGRIVFVGGGPGDPRLLTVRAAEVLAGAAVVVTDPDVPAAVVALAEQARAQPAVGEPAEVAKVLLTAARGGVMVARLVAGDVLSADAVVREVQAVARHSVPFEIVPGIAVTAAAAAYAGISAGSTQTAADVRSVADWERLAATPGPLFLQAGVGHLAAAAASLTAAGMPAQTPVAVTAFVSLPTQRTVDGTVAELDAMGRDLAGPLVVSVGSASAARGRLGWWESRALYGWRVLVPQTRGAGTEIAALLSTYGARCELVPTIAVEPPRTPAQIERAVKGLVDGRYQWVVFTSINSVRAVWDKFAEFGLDARAFSGVKIACVDQPTGAAVRALGIVPELVSTHPDYSTGLLDEFPDFDEILDPVNRVLLPRADIATETLAEGLRERGWEIDGVTAYRTVRAAPPPAEVREAIKSGGFDAVCFTSASTVRNLVGIAGKPHPRSIVACLGPKTAETAHEFGLRVDVQPEVSEVGSLVDALVAHADELRAQGALPPPRKSPRRH